MKIRVSNLPRVLYKDHYENKGVKPASCFIRTTMKIRRTTMKIRVSNLPRVLYKDHYENKGVKPARVYI